MKSHWKKFYPCDCHGEGVMLSNADFDDGDMNPCIDLAYFRNMPQYCDSTMSFMARLRFAWQILIKGEPFTDMVILKQKTAGELGKDLIKFSKLKIKRAKKTNKISVACGSDIISLGYSEKEIENLYHPEKVL
jgi:hypothetical protein